jgi:WD40 repeat protein
MPCVVLPGRCVVVNGRGSGKPCRDVSEIRDVDNGVCKISRYRRLDAVSSVAFSSVANRLVSSSDNYTIRVWDIQGMTTAGPSPFDDWILGRDGWLVGRGGRLLLWFPDNLRLGLWRVDRRDRLVIFPPGIPQIDLGTLVLSDYWRERFTG